MSFIYYCPHCGQKLEAPDELEGQNLFCPHCQKRIIPRNRKLWEYKVCQKSYGCYDDLEKEINKYRLQAWRCVAAINSPRRSINASGFGEMVVVMEREKQ